MTITTPSQADHTERNNPRWRDRMQSVGVRRTGIEIRVVDNAEHRLPVREAGEVLVRGAVVMTGYWGPPESTAEALRAGWPCTGDVGSFDATDLIITDGMNV